MPELSKLSLNAGELSDEIAGRIDLNKFNTGCEVLENAKVLRAGGATRRAGFEYLGATQNASGESRLVGFRFSEDQGFCLEFSNLKLRIHTAGALVATEYTTLWTTAQIFDLQFAQKIDRIVVTHPLHPVQNILKLAGGTWSVVEHPWTGRIWEPYPSTTEFTMTAGALTGSTTITADSAIFLVSPTWVGDRIQLVHTVDESTVEYHTDVVVTTPAVAFNANGGTHALGAIVYETTSGKEDYYETIAAYDGTASPDYDSPNVDVPHYIDTAPGAPFFRVGAELVPPTDVVAGWVFETFGTWDGTYLVQRSYDAGTTWSTIKIITSEDNNNERLVETETEPAQIRVLISRFFASGTDFVRFTVSSYEAKGSALIDSRASDTVVNVTVEEDFYSTATTSVWNEAVFSPRNGYPTGVTFYQGRLALGGPATRPQTFWLSRTQKPFDFTKGTLATDAMSFETDAEGYEAITWLSSHLSLMVGTTLGVWAVATPDGAALTPENNSIHRQMQLGAEKGFQAVPLQNNILFLQYKGRKIQELTGGSVEYGGYLSSDLTQLATHVTRKGITQIAGGELPDSVLYAVNGTELSILTYERAQNVVGWTRWITDGEFESVATTAGASEDDDVYVVINRDGVNDRYIGYLAPDMTRVEEDNDVPNLRFLDCYTDALVTGATPNYGRFEGVGSSATIPLSADLSLAWTIIAEITPDLWWDVSGPQTIFDLDNLELTLRLTSAGEVELYLDQALIGKSVPVPIVDGVKGWIKATHDAAGNYTVEYSLDGAAYTSLGFVDSIFSHTSTQAELGARATLDLFAGKMHAITWTGSENLTIDFTTAPLDVLTFAADTAQTVTLDGATIEVTLITSISGLSRFNGEQVDTFIDGEPYGLVTVTGGVATLPHGGLNAVVGLPYTTEIRPMSMDFGAIGSKSATVDAVIRFRNSLGGEVSQDRENWSKVQQLQPRLTTDVPLSLLSQDFQSTPHSTWDRKPSISVRQTQPLPMTVLAMRVKTKSSK
mgnify:CR=1 FL=1|tara:strand:- start:32296 stop:35310 length:3015 start_codon:yes stop_codon:yes gene_type:complete